LLNWFVNNDDKYILVVNGRTLSGVTRRADARLEPVR
jgi:hypothetical protein